MEIRESTEQSSAQRKQFVILTKLIQISSEVEHIDDLLSWLSSAIQQQFAAQAIQLWAVQATTSGKDVALLRAGTHEDPSLPPQVVYNPTIAKIAASFLQQRKDIPLNPVRSYFSDYQTKIFLRYGFNYCTGHFVHSSLLLPQRQNVPDRLDMATPLSMILLCFWHDIPSQDVLIALHNTLEQAISIARLSSFLQAAVMPSTGPLKAYHSDHLQTTASTLLGNLIPRRQDDENMRSKNPFARNPIPDKIASRLYYAIDGRKTVYQLASYLQLEKKEVFPTLRILLEQNLIQLYDTSGKRADKF